MRILITGSKGMIGQRLVRKLGEKHTTVQMSKEMGMDITRSTDCEKASEHVDVIIHAAAELDETKSPEEIWHVNVEGTQNMLHAAEKNDVKQFIFLSSVGVYGDTHEKLNEKSKPNPITTYEKSKYEAEQRVWGMQEVFPVTIIRPALVMGPNTYWEQIFKTVKKGLPLIGKGENAWQMVEVGELIEFIVRCVGNEDAYNEDYIVAEKETHTLKEVVDMIAEIEGVKKPGSIPPILGMAASHVFALQGLLTRKKPLLIPAHVKRLFKHREYDTMKARKLGWKPTLSTREALEKIYFETIGNPKKQ